MDRLPLRLTDDADGVRLTLGDQDITRFVAAHGLRVDYGPSAIRSLGQVPRPIAEVTITFGPGKLELDFDIELLERLLDDARARADR